MNEGKNIPFRIVTSHGEFQRHVLILKSLGYPIYSETLTQAKAGRGMESYSYLQYLHEGGKPEIVRSNGTGGTLFNSIEEFLFWYLDEETPEDKRIKEIDIAMRSLEIEKAGLIAKKTGAVC